MTKREKVVKGLETHADPNRTCVDCPYWNYGLGCSDLYSDTLKVLKEQKAEIESLEHNLAVAQDNLNYYINGNA